MGHYLESGFYGSGRAAWHKLGKVVEGRLTAEQALVEAGLDWAVHKQPLMVQATDGELDPVSDYFGMVRDFDNSVLGVVGRNYTPLQNSQAFDFFNSIVSNKEAIFETAGSLKNGRIIWILAKMPNEIVVKGKDIVDKYVLLCNSHDGSMPCQMKIVPQRVECFNMLMMALKGGAFTVRHTANIHDKVKMAAEAMGFANKMYGELGERYNLMAKKEMNQDDVIAYFKRCLKKSEHSKKQDMTEEEFLAEQEKDERDPRALTTLAQLHEEGMIKEIGPGNLWSAYNTVVEYVDHHRRVNGDNKEEGRVYNSAFGGQGMILKTKAYQEALTLLR